MNRSVTSGALLMVSVFAVQAEAETGLEPSILTVVLDFKGAHSGLAIGEMEREAGLLIEASGIRLDWRIRSEARVVANDLVVMTFTGACEFGPVPPRYDELGPYAITWITNGEVQPFGEVDCARVINSVRNAMWGTDFGRADHLVGRALGRVVAHELVHMLTKSTHHSGEGLERAALSGRELIAASLPLDSLDVERLKTLARTR